MTRFTRQLAALALGLVILAFAKPALAQSIIKQPGNHPNYSFEAEPHLLIGLWGIPGPGDDTGLGAGFRGSVVIVDNGFVRTINNSVAISFGIDWMNFDDNDDFVWLPVAMQWNFWLSPNWSVLGEPGLALRFNDDRFRDDVDLDFVFYAGGRYHFSDTVSLTMRLGWPSAFSLGVSFFM